MHIEADADSSGGKAGGEFSSLLLWSHAWVLPAAHPSSCCRWCRRLCFSPNGRELWAVTNTGCLDRYELMEGRLIQQVGSRGRAGASSSCSCNYQFVLTGKHTLVKNSTPIYHVPYPKSKFKKESNKTSLSWLYVLGEKPILLL